MKIVSNDYLSNVPGATRHAHGGPAVFAKHFSSFVTQKGHAWVGLINVYSPGGDVGIRKIAEEDGRRYHGLRFSKDTVKEAMLAPKRVDAYAEYAHLIRPVRAFLRRERPDVVFLNGFSFYAWLLLRAAADEKIPITIQHAGLWRVEIMMYRHMFSPAARATFLEMERDIVRCATTQIFLNEFSKRRFEKDVAAVPGGQAVIVPLPYKKEFISRKRPAKATSGRARIRIGCVARWDRIKNHAGLLAVVKAAQKEGLPWEFESVTSIPDTPAQARFKTEYRKRIGIVPPMHHVELRDFYARMDVMLLPSVFDVSPTVVMEAALVGTPTVISSSVGWVSEYHETGLQDWIADFSDPQDVIRRIQRCLRAPEKLTGFRTYVLERHAPQRVFGTYLRLFKNSL